MLDGLRTEHGGTAVTAHVEVRRSAVYVHWDDGLLVGLDPRTAEVLWHLETGTGEDDDRYWQLTSTPGSVVRYRDAHVRAYAAETGEERWATDLPAGCEVRGTRSDTSLGGFVLLRVSCRDHEQGVLALGP